MNIIEVNHLNKSYDDINAVKDICFNVVKGELFAFLGSNGAGKSTTINILCTFLKPDNGEVIIDGHILGKENHYIQKSIGIVFQENLLDDLLTVEENLLVKASLYGMTRKEGLKRIKELIEILHLQDFSKRRYGTLSGGQKRKCDIARALIHRPQILFLDEPTTGLDPTARQEVWNMLLSLQKNTQITIFLTTHYMEEALYANHIVIMDDGRIVETGTPERLRKKYTKNKLIILPKDAELKNQIKHEYILEDDKIIIFLNKTLDAISIINEYKDDILDFEINKGSMDDVFIEMTGKEL